MTRRHERRKAVLPFLLALITLGSSSSTATARLLVEGPSLLLAKRHHLPEDFRRVPRIESQNNSKKTRNGGGAGGGMLRSHVKGRPSTSPPSLSPSITRSDSVKRDHSPSTKSMVKLRKSQLQQSSKPPTINPLSQIYGQARPPKTKSNKGAAQDEDDFYDDDGQGDSEDTSSTEEQQHETERPKPIPSIEDYIMTTITVKDKDDDDNMDVDDDDYFDTDADDDDVGNEQGPTIIFLEEGDTLPPGMENNLDGNTTFIIAPENDEGTIELQDDQDENGSGSETTTVIANQDDETTEPPQDDAEERTEPPNDDEDASEQPNDGEGNEPQEDEETVEPQEGEQTVEPQSEQEMIEPQEDQDKDNAEDDGEGDGGGDPNDPSGVFDCRVASEVKVGSRLDVNDDDMTDISHVPDCEGGFTSGDFETHAVGSWYKVVGTGGRLSATACPALLSVLEGDCADLICAKATSNDFGCQAEWDSIRGESYYILIQSSTDLGAGEDGQGFNLDIQIVVEEVEPSSTDESDDLLFSLDQNPSGDGDPLIIEECKNNAIPVQINDRSTADFQFLLGGDFAPCEMSISPSNEDPLKGAWFAVAGNGRILRASSCPFQLSVYLGDCDDLVCAPGVYRGALACEFEWQTLDSRRDAVSYILVQNTIAGMTESGPFELSVFGVRPTPEIPSIPSEQPVQLPSPTSRPVVPTVPTTPTTPTTRPPTVLPPILIPVPTPEVTVQPTFAPTPLEERTVAPTFAPSFPTIPSTTPPIVSPGTQSPTVESSVPETPSRPTMPSITINPSSSPTTLGSFTPSPTFEQSGPPISTPGTAAPTFAPSEPVPTDSATVSPTFSQSVPLPTTLPESITVAPTFQPNMIPGTAGPTPAASPETSLQTGSPSSVGLTVVPTDDDDLDDVLLEQCRDNSITIEVDNQISSGFQFPLSEDFVACRVEVSPTKRKTIRATWFAVAGFGNVLEANACPYQLSLYTGGCGNLTCAEGTYGDARLCNFEWITPEDGDLSYILVQSTIAGFPETGDISLALTITDLGAPLLPNTSFPTLTTGLPTFQQTQMPSTETQLPSIVTQMPSIGTMSPTSNPSSSPATSVVDSLPPISMPTTPRPTLSPTKTPTTPTSAPSLKPVTEMPTFEPSSIPPTSANPTLSPTKNPTLPPSTTEPTSDAPTFTATTKSPTTAPTTESPTLTATTLAPTQSPSTASPTFEPTSSSPTLAPTTAPPTDVPTAVITTQSPTDAPTVTTTTSSPSDAPTATVTTATPTSAPTTVAPTPPPTAKETTLSPTILVTTAAPVVTIPPTVMVSSVAPNATFTPTVSLTTSTPVPSSTEPPLVVAPTISPGPTSILRINDNCQGALPLEAGSTIETSTRGATPETQRLDTCFQRDVGNADVTRPGIWYSIIIRSSTSSNQRFRVSACNGTQAETAPVQLTLYESDNSACDVLICAITINNLGCSLEFDVPLTGVRQPRLTYQLLVQQNIPVNNPNAGGVFWLSLLPVTIPPNDDCLRAQTVNLGDTIRASAQFATPEPMATVELCERDNGDLLERQDRQDPVPGLWYRIFVGGRVGILASGCNSQYPDLVHVTVYSGECNNLECLSDPVASPSGAACETAWTATSSESIYFILVERVLANGTDTGEFELSIELLFR